MVGKNNLDFEEVIKPYLRFFSGQSIDNVRILEDKKEDTDRDFLLMLEDTVSGEKYWLKSYQTRAEKILLPGISHLDEIDVVGVGKKGYIEKNHDFPWLFVASLEGIISKTRAAELIGNFYKNLHALGITFGDRLEDHSFYNESEGTLKISDFGLISSYIPALTLNDPFSKKRYDVNCYKNRLYLNAEPKDDIFDGLKFLSNIYAENEFKTFEEKYAVEPEDKKIFNKALNDFRRYLD